MSASSAGQAAEANRGRHASLLSDFLTTSAAQVLSVILNGASLAAISRRLGESDLGLYTLERRSMALLQPLVLLGLGVATPRMIALAAGRRSGSHRDYALAGTALVTGFMAATAALILLFPHEVAGIAFGDRDAVDLAYALAGFLVVMSIFQIVYSVFRGYVRMARANVLELTVVGILPLGLGLFGPRDLVSFMWALNAGIALAVAVVLVRPGARVPKARELGSAVRSRSGRLLRYGLARTPGDLAVVGLFSLAPLAVVHWHSPTEAGYTSVVLSSLNIVSVAAIPLGVLLLPRVAFDMGVAGGERSRKYALLAQASLDAAFGLAGLVLVASPLLIEFWLPSVPEQAVTAEQMASFGIPGYVFYLIFRSYLDAVHERPLSSVATLAGLAVLAGLLPTLLVTEAFSPTVSAAVALAIALTVTGAVTLVLVQRRLADVLPTRGTLIVLAAYAAIVLAGLAVRQSGLPVVAATCLLAGSGYGAVLVVARRPWLTEAREQIAGRRAESRNRS